VASVPRLFAGTDKYAFAVIMGVGWFRLIRARRSQLLLRSAAVPQKVPQPRPALRGDRAGAAAEAKSDTPGLGEKKDGTEI
jgi:hypothetical protein